MASSDPLTEAPVLMAGGLRKRYDRTEALRDFALTVPAGEVFGLIGPDGAGKSTFMKCAAGVLSHDAGRLEVLGTALNSERRAEAVKGRLGFMPQGLGQNLYPELSVSENIDFFAAMRQVPGRELAGRKRSLLELTRLEPFAGRQMQRLSGGMKQKLGLICTLIHAPELVILDEPTTGVDPASRRDFWTILSRFMRERPMTAVISTAYMDEARRFSRLSLVFEGQALEAGTPDAILGQAQGSIVRFEPRQQLEAVDRLRERFPQTEARGSSVRVFVPGVGPEEARSAVSGQAGGLVSEGWEELPPEMDDVVVARLRRAQGASGVQGSLGAGVHPGAKSQAEPGRDAILAEGLVRDFGDFRAVDRVSFRVGPGEILGLLGANGAGKTTVIKMLVGLIPPSGGKGRVAGRELGRSGRSVRRRIGYVSQEFSLYADLSVRENLSLYAGIYGVSRAELRNRAEALLEMAGLQAQASSRAGNLPVGFRQGLALICALVHRPAILFLDEPTSGVDPLGRSRFWDTLYRLARQSGVAVLVTTHYMNEAEYCDRLLLMESGRVVADASPEAMKADLAREFGSPLEIVADDAVRAQEILDQAGFRDASLFGRAVRILAEDPEAAAEEIPALLRESGLEPGWVSLRPLSMEDVFVRRIREQEEAA